MPSYSEPWELWTDHIHDEDGRPDQTVSDVKVYWWNGDSNYERYASHQTLSTYPDDESYRAESTHDWDYYGGTGLNVVENSPEDGSSSQQSIGLSISYAGVAINWNYSQGGDVDRSVSETTTDVTYDWYWDDFDNGEDSSTFQTGTEIAADTDPGLQEGLFEQNSYVNYYDNSDGTMNQHDFTQYIDMSD